MLMLDNSDSTLPWFWPSCLEPVIFLPLVVLIITIFILTFIPSLLTTVRKYCDHFKLPLPPGPQGVPIFGVLPKMRPKPQVEVERWRQKYGDVVSVRMGCRLCIILNSAEVVKECFLRKADVFCQRPDNYFKKVVNNTGLVFSEGEVWLEHRRFTLGVMRDFGMGREGLEKAIDSELTPFLEGIAGHDSKPFSTHQHLTKAVSNIICLFIYGKRFDYNDSEFLENLDNLSKSTRKQTMVGLVNFLPYLEFFLRFSSEHQKMVRYQNSRKEYAKKQIEKHKVTTENPTCDYIDRYLSKMQSVKEEGLHTTFSEEHLNRSIVDLFISGSEPVSNTLRWAFLLMAYFPEAQTRVQDELDQVVAGRRPSWHHDRSNLPLTEATMMEVQRFANAALFSIPRLVTKSTSVQGYHIPQGAWVFVNRYGLNVCDKVWKNPSEFDPTRFLNDEGKCFKPDYFLPFGAGPRNCLGELLARTELFMFFAATLQTFQFSFPGDQGRPSLEPEVGINMSPKPHLLIAKPR